MAVGQFTIDGIVQGSPNPQLVLPPYYIPSPTSEPTITDVALINGSTTITIPNGGGSNVAMAIFVPPNYAWPTPLTTYTGTIRLKGVSGDTGFTISNTWPTALAVGQSGSFVVTCSQTGTALLVCG
jgi:hypothetical protein